MLSPSWASVGLQACKWKDCNLPGLQLVPQPSMPIETHSDRGRTVPEWCVVWCCGHGDLYLLWYWWFKSPSYCRVLQKAILLQPLNQPQIIFLLSFFPPFPLARSIHFTPPPPSGLRGWRGQTLHAQQNGSSANTTDRCALKSAGGLIWSELTHLSSSCFSVMTAGMQQVCRHSHSCFIRTGCTSALRELKHCPVPGVNYYFTLHNF